MDWQKLQAVHDKALQAFVSYSLHYCEADDSWFFSVSSAAPSETWCGKNRSFDVAVESVLKWLDRVLGYLPCRLCGKAAYVPPVVDGGDHQHHQVACNNCGIEVCRLGEREAMEIWNRLMVEMEVSDG